MANLLNHLFSPIRIKEMEIPNRIVMPAMGTNLGNPDGTVSDANLAYMKRRAKGGAGLIITEISAVHPTGMAIPSELGSYDDQFIPGLKKLADVIHAGGSKAALQLHHTGRESFFLLKAGRAIAPSPIRSLVFGLTPREMTRDEIQDLIAAFGAAASRAKQAGFDAVEVHGAHGYLLTQFLSSLSNQRTDEYGGDIVKRSRFIREVLREVRRRVGDEFPVFLRLSAQEVIKGGFIDLEICHIEWKPHQPGSRMENRASDRTVSGTHCVKQQVDRTHHMLLVLSGSRADSDQPEGQYWERCSSHFSASPDIPSAAR